MNRHGTATEMVTGTSPKVVIHGRHIDLSEKFKDHVRDKLARIDRFGVVIMEIDVEVTHEQKARDPEREFEVELTCRGRGLVIRAEAHASQKWPALDLAYERLTERLRRAADKRHDRQHGKVRVKDSPSLNGVAHEQAGARDGVSGDDFEGASLSGGSDKHVLYAHGPLEVREKHHTAVPMTVAEAVDALELVGHDFYLFVDAEVGLPSVVYRRRGYQYGVIRVSPST